MQARTNPPELDSITFNYKEAARLIARQVVGDFSAGTHSGKFKTDVAEAVTLGFYMSRRLGWIESNVRRATNSMILVPRR